MTITDPVDRVPRHPGGPAHRHSGRVRRAHRTSRPTRGRRGRRHPELQRLEAIEAACAFRATSTTPADLEAEERWRAHSNEVAGMDALFDAFGSIEAVAARFPGEVDEDYLVDPADVWPAAAAPLPTAKQAIEVSP